MTVSSVKTGELGLSFALNNNYMEPIATTLVGAGGLSTITFSDIPQTYKHLQLRTFNRNASGDYHLIRFNNDTSANYAWHQLRGSGSAATAAALADRTYGEIPWSTYNSLLSNTFAAAVTDILDYTDTNKFKTVRSLGGGDANGSGSIVLASSLWRSTSAITKIDLIPDGNYQQYSRLSLYGIKG